MVALVLFVIATLVALMLYDQYVQESVEQVQTKNFVEKRAEPEYSRMSLFTVLGLSRDEVHSFSAFRDHFTSFSEVSAAMQQAGLEHARLIVGIDYTASNEWQGRRTFKGECLHALKGTSVYNPYQRVLSALGHALQPLLQGTPIAAFGFGDIHTKNREVFPLRLEGTPCLDFHDLMDAYTHNAQRVQLSGPSSFGPILRKAVEIVQKTHKFHILLLVTDGQMKPDESATRHGLVLASRNAMCIIAVGVGDGPWHTLEEWDDRLPDRNFDNLQFVNYHQVVRSAKNPETALALHALMEVPDQYQTILKLGYLDQT